jgi:hypothetical protein
MDEIFRAPRKPPAPLAQSCTVESESRSHQYPRDHAPLRLCSAPLRLKLAQRPYGSLLSSIYQSRSPTDGAEPIDLGLAEVVAQDVYYPTLSGVFEVKHGSNMRGFRRCGGSGLSPHGLSSRGMSTLP